MCEDLTNQTVYAMRSLGIPVVVDFTPYWPMELNRFPLWGNGSALKDGRLYSLYYWDDSWVKVGEMQAINGTVIFEDVPSNAVYRLLPEYEPKARIFLYNKGEMIVH